MIQNCSGWKVHPRGDGGWPRGEADWPRGGRARGQDTGAEENRGGQRPRAQAADWAVQLHL